MRARRSVVSLGMLPLLAAVMVVRGAGIFPYASPLLDGWGGKAEHCAMAIGAIGASILSLFANPFAGPAAVGVMSLGLIWMVATCE